MTSELEHRYRRVLRLLPTGYRQAWEEDMVTTFLASTASGGEARRGRPSLAERMSVVALAVRLHLGATRPLTEVRPRHRVLHCIALMFLLFLALSGTTEVVSFVHRAILYARGELMFINSEAVFIATMIGSALLSVLWVVAFWHFVLGRFAVPRLAILVTLGLMIASLAVMVPQFIGKPVRGLLGLVPVLATFGALAWFTIAAFKPPADARAPRPRLWLGGYVVGAIALAAIQIYNYVSFTPWVRYVDLGDVTPVAVLGGMVVALVAGRDRPDWLFALALVGGGLVLLAGWDAFESTGSTLLNVMLIVLAVACALRGRVAARAA